MAPRVARAVLALLVLLAMAFTVENFSRPLANPDEGRYSEISREMAASGDWVTPRLNGIKYFEKPPLQYWASAVAFRLLGASERSARAYVALCALATLLLVGYTAMRLSGAEAGLAAMVALLSSPYFMALAGVVTLDMGLTLWTTLTLCAYLLAQRPGVAPGARRAWLLLAWAAMALAVLSKGLVGVVFPAAALTLACLMRRDLSPLARLEWLFGPFLFLALAAPWFVLVSIANPEFPGFFFIHEHFERFLTSEHGRAEPWWYFAPIAALGFLPWMFALPAAVRQGWRAPSPSASGPALRMALAWAAFVVAFFSLSGSKLPTYILPAFPAMALVLGPYLAQAPPRAIAYRVLPGVLVGIALLWAAAAYPSRARDAWTWVLYLQAQPWVVAGAALFAVLAPIVARLLLAGQRWPALLAMAAGMVLVVDLVEQGFRQVSPRTSGLVLAQKMQPLLGRETRLYSVAAYDQTVPFYLGRTLKLVDYGDEFTMGLRSEPALRMPLDAFARDWRRPGDALAIMHPETYRSLRSGDLPMQVLHEDPRRILVRKP